MGLFSIPTAPTITPDDSVALTLLGRVSGVEKAVSCSQLNLISTRLRLGRTRKFSCQGRAMLCAHGRPGGELGQFDSGDRIATVVLSHLASRWPHDGDGVGASNVRFDLTTFGL